MDSLKFVGRQWEIDTIKQIIEDSSSEGKSVLIKAPPGMGKSVLLQMLKNEFENPDQKILCFCENLLTVDTPTIFLGEFLSNLQSHIHHTKSQIKEFFSKYGNIVNTMMQSTLSITSAVGNIPDLSRLLPLLTKDQQEKSQALLEREFIKMMQDFTENFPDHKLVLMIDGIDHNQHRDAFLAVLEDVTKSLLNNVTIIVPSVVDILDSGELISLTNFNEYETREFVEKNLGLTKEEEIDQVMEKSGGYPLSLDWLWQNYKRGENLTHLLLRLPKEGFVDLLQKNYLNLLDEDEIRVLKVSAALDIIESRTVSKIGQIEEQRVKEILDDFDTSDVLYLINYEELTNKQILNFYILNDTFQKLIDSNYGQDVSIHKRALDHYVNSLFENLHYVKSRLIGIILRQYEQIAKLTGNNMTDDDFFSCLNLNNIQKFQLCNEIIQYYRFANDQKRAQEWSKTQIKIAQHIDEPNQLVFYTKMATLNRFFTEENKEGAKQTISELADWMESSILPITEDSKKVELQSYIDSMRSLSSLVIVESPLMEDLVNAIFGKEQAKNLLAMLQNKLFQGMMILKAAEEFLGANNFEFSVEAATEGLELLVSITSTDIEEFSKISGTLFTSTTLDQIKALGKMVLGIAHLCFGEKMMEVKDCDKNKIKENLSKAVELLEPFKSDEARGHFYFNAKSMLESLDQYEIQ